MKIFSCRRAALKLKYKDFTQIIICRYVSALERTVIRTLRMMGITAHTSPHTGVWVGNNKICALGMTFTGGAF